MHIMSFCDLLNPKFDMSDIIYINDTQGFNLYFFEKDPAFLIIGLDKYVLDLENKGKKYERSIQDRKRK